MIIAPPVSSGSQVTDNWVGAAPALINNSLVHDALLHCVAIPKTKFLLVDSEEGCQSRIGAAADKLQNDLGIQILVHDDTLKRHIAQFPRTQPPRELIASLGAKTPYAIMYTRYNTLYCIVIQLLTLFQVGLQVFQRHFRCQWYTFILEDHWNHEHMAKYQARTETKYTIACHYFTELVGLLQ